jgi:hypothetical protein
MVKSPFYVFLFKNAVEPSVVVRTCNPSTSEVEAGRSGVRDQSELHSEFEASLDFMRPPTQHTHILEYTHTDTYGMFCYAVENAHFIWEM